MKQTQHILSIIIASLLMLCACTNGADDAPGAGVTDPADVVFGASSLSMQWQSEPRGRATDYPIEPVKPQSIGVWGYNDCSTARKGAGEVFCNVEMYYTEGELFHSMQQSPNSWAYGLTWEYSNQWAYEDLMPWIPSTNYKFVIYSPFTVFNNRIATDSIGVNDRSFANFNTLTRKHIQRCSNSDIMVSAQMLAYRSKGSGNPVQLLQLMHTQSRLRFCFRLGDRYSDLRYIVLHKVEITDSEGCTVTLNSTYDTSSPTTAYPVTNTWSVETNAYGEVILTPTTTTLANDNGITELILDKDNRKYQPMASTYVYPGLDLEKLDIKVTYDVYDTSHQLMRKDETAQNTINLNLYNEATATEGVRKLLPGFFYDVKINIEPKFLYVLSDYDISADGFIVIAP